MYINNCNARFVIFAKDIKILSMLMIMTHLVPKFEHWQLADSSRLKY